MKLGVIWVATHSSFNRFKNYFNKWVPLRHTIKTFCRCNVFTTFRFSRFILNGKTIVIFKYKQKWRPWVIFTPPQLWTRSALNLRFISKTHWLKCIWPASTSSPYNFLANKCKQNLRGTFSRCLNHTKLRSQYAYSVMLVFPWYCSKESNFLFDAPCFSL